jgi:hypothetical protein
LKMRRASACSGGTSAREGSHFETCVASVKSPVSRTMGNPDDSEALGGQIELDSCITMSTSSGPIEALASVAVIGATIGEAVALPEQVRRVWIPCGLPVERGPV